MEKRNLQTALRGTTTLNMISLLAITHGAVQCNQIVLLLSSTM